MSRTNVPVLVTGGLGYIGSHVVVALLKAGYLPVIVDNLSNARREVVDGIRDIAGVRPAFHRLDIRDRVGMRELLAIWPAKACIHCAGLKAVGDSVSDPVSYYDVNVGGSAVLFGALVEAGCHRIIFSSSATVYGAPQTLPIPENHPISPIHPYGHSKAMVERMLQDLCAAREQVSAIALRYFNPAGAHSSGLIGERPSGTPNNLMPYVSQVASGRRPQLQVYGADYDTPDGTGVRDYVHVMDLADAHVAALEKSANAPGWDAINLGTGDGYSVLQLVQAYREASGHPIPYRVVDRRAGDIASCYADAARALARLGWHARRGLREMCEDALAFERRTRAVALS